METTIRTYGELCCLCGKETGIYRRLDDRDGSTEIYIVDTDRDQRPTNIRQYVSWYDVDGDDKYMADLHDTEGAPHISYERIDEYANVTAYLTKEQVEKALANRREALPHNPGKKDYLLYDIELLEAYLNK